MTLQKNEVLENSSNLTSGIYDFHRGLMNVNHHQNVAKGQKEYIWKGL